MREKLPISQRVDYKHSPFLPHNIVYKSSKSIMLSYDNSIAAKVTRARTHPQTTSLHACANNFMPWSLYNFTHSQLLTGRMYSTMYAKSNKSYVEKKKGLKQRCE